jgi:hypothetical protein
MFKLSQNNIRWSIKRTLKHYQKTKIIYHKDKQKKKKMLPRYNARNFTKHLQTNLEKII